MLLFKYILYYIVFLSFFPSFLFTFSFLGLPSLLVPSGLWHFALSVGVCSLADSNNNNNIGLMVSLKSLHTPFHHHRAGSRHQ